MLEVLPVFQVGNSLVRDGFRVVQIERLHVLQRGQVLQALVRDFRIGQVDALQLRQARQLRQVGVRHPGVAQIDADRFSGGIAEATRAECGDLRSRDRPRPQRWATSRPRQAPRNHQHIMLRTMATPTCVGSFPFERPARSISFDGVWDRSISDRR